MNKSCDFSAMQGSTLHEIRTGFPTPGICTLIFYTSNGVYWMGHHTDCCESVTIEEVHGNPVELKDSHITIAYESTNNELGAPVPNQYESQTWTFYHIQTTKGDLTIRWLGESNGYYSERVDFEKMEDETIVGVPWTGQSHRKE